MRNDKQKLRNDTEKYRMLVHTKEGAQEAVLIACSMAILNQNNADIKKLD